MRWNSSMVPRIRLTQRLFCNQRVLRTVLPLCMSRPWVTTGGIPLHILGVINHRKVILEYGLLEFGDEIALCSRQNMAATKRDSMFVFVRTKRPIESNFWPLNSISLDNLIKQSLTLGLCKLPFDCSWKTKRSAQLHGTKFGLDKATITQLPVRAKFVTFSLAVTSNAQYTVSQSKPRHLRKCSSHEITLACQPKRPTLLHI